MTDIDTFEELLAWTRVMATEPFNDLLDRHLKTSVDYDVFEATDGSRNRDEVGKAAGIAGRAVGNRWAVWRAVGIVFDPRGGSHPRHLASASSVGYPRPVSTD